MKFDQKTVKFPKTEEGQPLSYKYYFENTGDSALVISHTEVACTCTEVAFPKYPINPGEKGVIGLKFDTHGKIGYQNRDILIYSNASTKPARLKFKVVVDNP